MDKFLNIDKILHFTVGLLVSVGFALIHPICSLPATFFVAYAKEYYDYKNIDKHTPDWNDFIATIVGGLFGTLQFIIFNMK